MSGERKPMWPMAQVTGIELDTLLVEFEDAVGELRAIAVRVPDSKAFELGQVVDLSRKSDDGVKRSPVKKEQVTIRPEKLYTISVNGKKMSGLFKEQGSLSGMRKMVRVGNGPYCEVVVDCPDDVFEVIRTVMCGDEELDVTVVKASSDFVDEMMEAVKETAKGE